ncbi:MAG: hypothetical protein DMG57_27000 [Acidobacteria bacterium]|nr:MAG: hypothetical protein DMG57_27000 [Acidobacteriota bacterium]
MQVTGNFGVGGAITRFRKPARFHPVHPAIASSVLKYPTLQAFSLPRLQPLGSQSITTSAVTSLNDSERLIRFGSDSLILSSTAGLLVFHTPLAGPVASVIG